MRRHTFWVAAGLAMGGCAANADKCAPIPPQTLGRGDSIFGDAMLFGDDRGFIAFWSVQTMLSAPDTDGVFAARPGTPAVRLVAANAPWLAVMPVTGGFLVCWADSGIGAGTSRAGGCSVVDHDLRLLRPFARPSYGSVLALGRVHGRPYAIADDGVDNETTALVPLDEAGHAAGLAISAPCTPRGRLTWSDAGIACLEPSSPHCGGQFGQPPDCANDLSLLDVNGERLWTARGVAPFGQWSALVPVHVVASGDGYGVSWFDDRLRIRIVAGGTPGEVHDVAYSPALESPVFFDLFAAFGAYLAVWLEGSSARLPRALLFDDNGRVLAGPFTIGPPEANLAYSETVRAVATAGQNLGVTWLATTGHNAPTDPAVEFQALGCLAGGPDAGR